MAGRGAISQMMDWQPIKTAPKDGTWLLLHVPKGLETGAVTVGALERHRARREWALPARYMGRLARHGRRRALVMVRTKALDADAAAPKRNRGRQLGKPRSWFSWTV